MKKICDKRCIIGEGPIWNVWEEKLYFTNGYGNEICCLDIETYPDSGATYLHKADVPGRLPYLFG